MSIIITFIQNGITISFYWYQVTKINFPPDSPEIKVEKSIVYAVEGYNKSIACFALGHPFPEVQWFLNDIARTESHLNVSFLQLKDIDRVVHHKKYKCRAVSKSPKYGLLKSKLTIEIFVYCKFIFTKESIDNSYINNCVFT